MNDTTTHRHRSCDTLPEVTPQMRADTIAGLMRHQFGELFFFAHTPHELAEACEIRPEIAAWMQHTATYSECIQILWSRTKPLMDCRAAARAIQAL